jgi:hypothetical protein
VSNDERYEQIIAFIGSHLPAPLDRQETSDGSLMFTGGDPAEVVVHLTDTNVIVSEFAGDWVLHGGFMVKPRRLGLLRWTRIPETHLMNALSVLIRAARETRLSRYRPCSLCGATCPPEALVGEMCTGCGEQLLTVVH